ncbi:MAG: hypothetical protein ACYDFS_02080 [Vulcanimicrobiaceae bacterium]
MYLFQREPGKRVLHRHLLAIFLVGFAVVLTLGSLKSTRPLVPVAIVVLVFVVVSVYGYLSIRPRSWRTLRGALFMAAGSLVGVGAVIALPSYVTDILALALALVLLIWLLLRRSRGG